MRTTLSIDEDLLKQLKEAAARQGRPMAELVNDLLRQSLAGRSRLEPYKFELEGWEAELQPGVDLQDRDKLFDLLDGR